jgi:HD-GYP domain-containing protein (c-di-GMP phosphodiesterase class II)
MAADFGSDGLEPSEVMTETMAELYSRQSLHHRAALLYRQLLARNPGDERLRAKLRAAERAAGESQRGPPEPEEYPGIAEPGLEVAATPEPEPSRPEPPKPEGLGPELSPIRAQLQSMLAWQPGQEPLTSLELEVHADEREAQAPVRQAGSAAEIPAEREPHVERDLEPPTRTLIALTDMLVGVLEYRDVALRGRTSLTRTLAESMARELGTTPADQSAVALAALLRNIGRVAEGPPREATDSEPRPRLERQLNRTMELLDGTGVPTSVRLAVQHRHERWDGTGYPHGLARNDIPRLARVLAVADAFAGMVSPPAGKRALSVHEASQRLLESSGLEHDPTVVRALVRLLERRDQPLRAYVDRPRILLVERGPGAVLTTTKLDSAGYRVEVVDDVDSARNRLPWFDPAALVASARVGERPIADLVRNIRSDKMLRNIAVVVVDASSVAFRVWLLEHGADVCFPPGTTHAEIRGTLAALVRRGRGSSKRAKGD